MNSAEQKGGKKPIPPRITYLRVRNYRALKDIELKDLTPLTVLLGPNGSGKSTLFDVFSFLSECFQTGLRHAWDRRGRAKELKSRGQDGPIVIEFKYKERKDLPLITYHLAINDTPKGPIVDEEWLSWKRGSWGKPFRFLDYKQGQGEAISGESPEIEDQRKAAPLRSPDLLAVNSLGQFTEHPRVAALREFITDWHVSYLSIEDTRIQPEAGPQERLSRSGDNLANVVQFLKESHPASYDNIIQRLRNRVPRLEDVIAEPMPDGRLLLQMKDGPFNEPVLAKFVSDGTLKMLAYLIVLNDPALSQFIGIEEPENFLHPRLLPGLAEECLAATEQSQLLVTTHSPFFINSMQPDQVHTLYRDKEGYTRSKRVSDIPKIKEFIQNGAKLGDLWVEGFFMLGDPLLRGGLPEGDN